MKNYDYEFIKAYIEASYNQNRKYLNRAIEKNYSEKSIGEYFGKSISMINIGNYIGLFGHKYTDEQATELINLSVMRKESPFYTAESEEK